MGAMLGQFLDRGLSLFHLQRLQGSTREEILDPQSVIPNTDVSAAVTDAELRQMMLDPTIAGGVNLVLIGALPEIVWTPSVHAGGQKAVDVINYLIDQMPGSFIQRCQTALEEAFVMRRSYTEMVRGYVPGGYMGLYDMVTVPEERLDVKRSPQGVITSITQSSMAGGRVPMDLDRLGYFAFRPTASSPFGRSGLMATVQPYRRKLIFLRAWSMYLRRRSGFLYAELSKDQFNDTGKAAAKATLKSLDMSNFGVFGEGQALKLLESSGTPGALFQTAVKYLDKQILMAMLCQELATAEGMLGGSRATAQAHGDIMWTYLHQVGDVFREAYVREEIGRRLLSWNGYETLPVPKPAAWDDSLSPEKLASTVEGLVNSDIIPWTPEAAGKLMEDLGLGHYLEQDNAIEVTGDGAAAGTREPQKAALNGAQIASLIDIVAKLKEGILTPEQALGIASMAFPTFAQEEVERAIGEAMAEVAAANRHISDRGSVYLSKLTLAKVDRRVQKAKQNGKKQRQRAEAAAVEVSKVWQDAMPVMYDRIMKVFKADNLRADGLLNPDAFASIRAEIERAVKVRGSEIKSVLLNASSEEWKIGQESMVSEIGTRAARPSQKPPLSLRQMLKVLDVDIQARLGDEFGKLTKDIYMSIRSGTLNGQGPREIAPAIRGILGDAAFAAPNRALTITLTELGHAFNEARWQNAVSLHDAMGRTSSNIVGYEYVIVDDEDTTDICLGRAGQFFMVDDPGLGANWPPLHYNCRSQMVPIFGDEYGDVEKWTPTTDLKVQPMEGFGGLAV